MKNFKWMVAAVVFFAFAKANTLQAQQEFQAIAHYVAQTKFDIKEDTTKSKDPMQDEMKRKFREALSKGSQQEYKMEFTGTESVYDKVVELAKPSVGSEFSVSFSNNNGVGATIYKNLSQQMYYKEAEIFGKEFLIKDSFPTYNWQLSQETKQIGNYLCYKATYVPELTEIQKEAKKKREEKKETGGLLAQIETNEDRTITAWYTPEIPISNGPGEYQGLPGFILEVKEKNTVLLCTKIEINPAENLKIKQPKSGKEISQKEFDALYKKKYDERMEKQGGKGFIIISETRSN
ncbi:GLPGLI family protein [Nonlabens marinus]|uniref:GLPGLI family protein n=1 Tax=Nonlabens marinus S1-08 TaxID=1454201 RepID=W8VNJ1_9FLAO|nr:GLPGLI family protein [Nonlabens marinus]BAO54494.1 hypothetical protein NMS_0485 [Nonlabens marinus S1-08]